MQEEQKESLKVRFKKSFPPLYVHFYYLFAALTVCYLYYHKHVDRSDFFNNMTPGGLFAILDFQSVNPVQYRIFTPFLYKAFLTVFGFIGYKPAYLLMILLTAYLIVLCWYYCMNHYFSNRQKNFWLAPIILYPAIWNLIILNGQFFNYDFSLLLFMVLGFYFIVTENNPLLLLTVALGTLNHDSIIFIVFAYILFNIRTIFKSRQLIYTLLFSAVYIAIILLLQQIFKNNASDYKDNTGVEHFFFSAFSRNLDLVNQLKPHIIFRNIFLNFGGLLLFAVILLIKYRKQIIYNKFFYINLFIIPYIFLVFYRASIEEMRNYNAIIPFITITFLLGFAKLPGSFMELTWKVTQKN